MKRRLRGWSGTLSGVGDAATELAAAELAALREEIGRSGRELTRALLLVAVALFALFWSLGLGMALAVEVAARWLPRWGAVAVVLAAVLVLATAAGAWGAHRLRSLESPLATVRRRWRSHRRWWSARLAESAEAPPEPPGAA